MSSSEDGNERAFNKRNKMTQRGEKNDGSGRHGDRNRDMRKPR